MSPRAPRIAPHLCAVVGIVASVVLICATAQAASPHRYEISVDESLDRLAVHACFDGKAPQALVADSDGARLYLESMHIGERPLAPAGDKVILGIMPENACVDYQVKLQPAQSRAQTGGPETRRVGRDMLTAIGDWLWRPQEPEADIELRFHLPSGVEVSAPWQRTAGSGGPPLFLTGAFPYNWSGVVAFGRFVLRDIQVPGAVLHVAILDAATPAQQAQLEMWIENTARNITLLYGRFPVASLQVVVAPTPRGRGPVPWAYVSRGGGPAVHLFINAARPPEEFERDWSLSHEMSHLFLPYVVSRDAWLFEGVPTYLQNVLMARGGATSVEEAWRRMQAGFQRGARTAPELSLARANERVAYSGIYQRVYWAGAALMLAADLQLRNRTGGAQSLDTALEQLSRCCASQQRRWSAQEIIVRLDEITGTSVFSDLVRAQFEAEGFPDYEAILARAGVKVQGTQVEFDGSAPWAAERDALMQPGH
ncbi:MAG TPA: hypothetical protein VKD04_12155 [Burkholderiales bacterium]|nr:hypothetical protein [Burkholderiales bacterium]